MSILLRCWGRLLLSFKLVIRFRGMAPIGVTEPAPRNRFPFVGIIPQFQNFFASAYRDDSRLDRLIDDLLRRYVHFNSDCTGAAADVFTSCVAAQLFPGKYRSSRCISSLRLISFLHCSSITASLFWGCCFSRNISAIPLKDGMSKKNRPKYLYSADFTLGCASNDMT